MIINKKVMTMTVAYNNKQQCGKMPGLYGNLTLYYSLTAL